VKVFLEIKLAGGLGNQLFQYATARIISVKNKIPFLLFNIDKYSNESLGRRFGLLHLNIKGRVIRNQQVKNIFSRNTKLNRLVSAVNLHEHIEENGFVLQPLDHKAGFLTSITGYWQSANYFNDIRPLLLKEITPLQIPSYPAWLTKQTTVAIHVRRTDYLAEPRYGFLGADYYARAISYMKSQITNPLFVIFSDDMEWCRQEFKEEGFLFFGETAWQADYLQLHLMSKCTHQIIANSTFSWWAAWLNSRKEKIVLRPLTPFQEKTLLYEAHYPEEWIAINNN